MMPRRCAPPTAFLLVHALACAPQQPPAPAAPTQTSASASSSDARGVVIPPGGGERFVYCTRPLTLWIKLDSATAPGTQLVAGTGAIRGDEGIGRHRDRHEIVYIRSGWGRAIIGTDTSTVGPGSFMYVPPATPHRFVSTGAEPLDYFWVIAPMSSAQGFRDAAGVGCLGGPPVPAPAPPVAMVTPSEPPLPGLSLAPGAGERLTYCRFPLTVTFKVDSSTAPGSLLVGAAGALRRGMELSEAGHPVDEIVLITHGRGYAFVGADTMRVEAGSIVYTPPRVRHGFINEHSETLEYVVVYGPWDAPRSRAGFRRLAAQPGPWCPAP